MRALSLPSGEHSMGLRRLALLEAVRGSFDQAQTAIERRCGRVLGKRRLEQLVAAASGDIDSFYQQHIPVPSSRDVLLIMEVDGKGVVMRPEALRPATQRARLAAEVGHRSRPGYVCFEDEAGFTRRPPKGRTWGRRGHTPQVTESGRRSGRRSVAGLIAIRPGSRTRLCHRLRTHPAGKGKRRSMGERDFIALIDGTHQLVKAPIVLVWDRLNTHVSHAMHELIAEREWLTVFLLPAYSPDLNPVEGV